MKTRLSSLNPLLSIFIAFFVAVAITSCGGGGGSSDVASNTNDSDQEGLDNEGDQDDETDMGSSENIGNTETNTLTGVFIDSPVEGLSYSTETQSGITNTDGEFSYISGEIITFSIEDITFPAVAVKEQLTPIDLATGSNNPNDTAINIARLIQSLDDDGNPENGILIASEAAANSAPIDFDVSTVEFENSSTVVNLVANSGSVNTMLVGADDAISHLSNNVDIGDLSNNTPLTTGGENQGTVDQVETIYTVNGSVVNYEQEPFYDFDAKNIKVRVSVVEDTGVFQTGDEFQIIANAGICLTPSLELGETSYIDYLNDNEESLLSTLVADTSVIDIRQFDFQSNNSFQYSADGGDIRDAVMRDGVFQASSSGEICFIDNTVVQIIFLAAELTDGARIFVDFIRRQ